MNPARDDFETEVRTLIYPIHRPLPIISRLALQKTSQAIELLGMEGSPITQQTYPKLHADMFLASLHAGLLTQDLGDWKITNKTDRLHIHHSGLNVDIRVLKSWKEGAPPAGRNRARQDDWMQPELAYSTNIKTALNGMTFLLLWCLSGERVDFMLTHPSDAGQFPECSATDFIMRLGVEDYMDRRFAKTREEDFYIPNTNLVLPKTNAELTGKDRR